MPRPTLSSEVLFNLPASSLLRHSQDVIAGTIDLDPARLLGGRGVLQAGDVVAAEQLGVPHHDMRLAGRGATGVVDIAHALPGPFVVHVQHSIHLIVLVTALQPQTDLLGRVFLGQLEAGRHLVQLGRLPFLQCRQAAPDVGFIEILIVF